MEQEIKMPVQRLAEQTVPALRLGSAVGHGITAVLLAVLYGLNVWFSWGRWAEWTIAILAAITLLSAVWGIGVRPVLLHRYYRYSADEDFLQLKSGAFHEVHELVPMAKIQAVSTNQGPILRRYNLYSLEIETMGSTHGIPALQKEKALELRNMIAVYAKIREVDE